MSLKIPQLIPQLEDMAQAAVKQAAEFKRLLPQAEQALDTCAAQDIQDLVEKINRAGSSWRGASPTTEAANAVIPPPPASDEFATIGADGSQILADRHGLALYYLINTGSIAIRHGSGEAPLTASHPQLFFEEQDLYPGGEALIGSELVAAKRDVAEMAELARLAEEQRGPAIIALLDNGLLLWIAAQKGDHPPAQIEPITNEYLQSMQRIRTSGAALAGYIDRPRSASVIRLLHLAGMPLEAINHDSLRAHPFQRLTDRMLFSTRLPAGHRSARFGIVSSLNQDFTHAGHGIQFFYLNTGFEDQIARVELPDWVAENQALLDLVHAGIIEECRITGMPYVLVRAHELAVVTQPDRQALERALNVFLLEQGLHAEVSQKERAKRWTGSVRRMRRSPLL